MQANLSAYPSGVQGLHLSWILGSGRHLVQTLLSLRRPCGHALGHTLVEGLIGQGHNRLVQVCQGLGTVSWPPHIAGEPPGWKVFLDGVDIDVHPTCVLPGLRLVRQPRHIDVQQQTPIGLRQERRRIKPKKARRVARYAQPTRAELHHANATQLRQCLEGVNRLRLAPQIRGDDQGVIGRHQFTRDLQSGFGRQGPHAHRAVTLGRVRLDLFMRPRLDQGLSRQRQINRTGRLGVHDTVRAAHHLFGHHTRGQVVFPLDVGAHQRSDVKGVLHIVHIVITRTRYFSVQGIGRFACHEQDRQTGTHQIVHAHGRVGSACVHMHHDALPLPRHGRITTRHVDGHVFVRTQHHLRHGLAFGLQAGHFVNQGDVVGSQIGEQITDARFLQAF